MAVDFNKTQKVKKGKPKKQQEGLVLPDAQIQKDSFVKYENEIKLMGEQARTLKVENDESNKEAIELGSQAKKLNNTVEKQRKEIVEAPNQFVKTLNAFCKTFTDPLKQIENDLKRKISQFQAQRELDRRKAEKRAQEEAKKLQDKLDKEAKETGIEAPTVPEIAMPKPQNVTRADSGVSSFQKKIWTFEIIDPSLVTRDYLMINEQSIRNAIKMGVREIPGVRIYEHSTTVLKSA